MSERWVYTPPDPDDVPAPLMVTLGKPLNDGDVLDLEPWQLRVIEQAFQQREDGTFMAKRLEMRDLRRCHP